MQNKVQYKTKKTQPLPSNSLNIYEKLENIYLKEKQDFQYKEPQPASLYEDNYVEYQDTDNDTESIKSSTSSTTKEKEIYIEDEEYKNSYSFIYKLNQNSLKKKKPNIQLKLDEYDIEDED